MLWSGLRPCCLVTSLQRARLFLVSKRSEGLGGESKGLNINITNIDNQTASYFYSTDSRAMNTSHFFFCTWLVFQVTRMRAFHTRLVHYSLKTLNTVVNRKNLHSVVTREWTKKCQILFSVGVSSLQFYVQLRTTSQLNLRLSTNRHVQSMFSRCQLPSSVSDIKN